MEDAPYSAMILLDSHDLNVADGIGTGITKSRHYVLTGVLPAPIQLVAPNMQPLIESQEKRDAAPLGVFSVGSVPSLRRPSPGRPVFLGVHWENLYPISTASQGFPS
jgi:hypothetical protein